MITAYFAFGLGFYIGLAMNNPSSFRGATKIEIARGIALALFLWPVALIALPFMKDRLK